MAHFHRLDNGIETGPDIEITEGMHVHEINGGHTTQDMGGGEYHTHGGGMTGPLPVEQSEEGLSMDEPKNKTEELKEIVKDLIDKNYKKPIDHDPRRETGSLKKEFKAELFTIPGVEVFAAGVWNGDKYTIQDLDEMVRAFEETAPNIRPYLKLGHDDKQSLIQKDGLPAAGWINRVYRTGEKLYADFVDIPRKIFELIENRAYRKVSSEIYWNIHISGKKYKYLLSAVSLLGSDWPAVSSLSDILANYGLKFGSVKSYGDKSDLHVYDYQRSENMSDTQKTEAQIKLEFELKEKEALLKKQEDQIKEYKSNATELEQLRKYKKETAEKIAKAEAEATKAKNEAFVGELEKQNLSSPAMKPYILEFLGEDKKEYSINDKAYGKQELIEEILKLHAKADVNLRDNSLDAKKDDSKEKELEENINKYMADHNVGYKEAYVAVYKD